MKKNLFSLNIRDYSVFARAASAAIIAAVCATAELPLAAELFLCIFGFLLAACGLVISVIKSISKSDFFTPQLIMLLADIAAFGAGRYPEAVLAAVLFCACDFISSKLLTAADSAVEAAGMRASSSEKSRFEAFADAYMRFYVPAVVVIALLIALVPLLFDADFRPWLARAEIFLLAVCPCAVILSALLGYRCFIGAAAKRGVAVSSAACAEKLASVNTVVFDGSSVFPGGDCRIAAVVPAKGLSEQELLMLASFAEFGSSHPAASAILKAYGKQVDSDSITASETLPGLGVLAHAKGIVICAGNIEMMDKLGLAARASELSAEKDSVHIAVNGSYAGCIKLQRTVPGSIKTAVAALKSSGTSRIILLSEEDESSAARLAHELGISEYFCCCSETDKKTQLEKLLADTFPEEMLAFVGSSSELLAMADVGVSVGEDVDGASVIIPRAHAGKLAELNLAARRSRSSVWQGIIIAAALKLIIFVTAIFGLAPFWLAVISDCGLGIICALNSVRSLRAF